MPGVEDQSGAVKEKFKDVCRKFCSLQEQRIQTYHVFERGYRDYLNAEPGHDFGVFKKLAYEVTCEFNRISKEIIEMDPLLRSLNLEEASTVADLISKIQDKEKIQLEKTVELFVAQDDQKDESFGESTYLNSKLAEYRKDLEDLRSAITEEVEEIRMIMLDIC